MRGAIARDCATAGRDPADLTLIAVTKGFPVEDIRLLAELGVTDVGESRAAEGLAKREDVAAAATRLTWHCIGQVQTNKAAQVARWADVVHSVDRESLVRALSRGAQAASRRLQVLIQVDIRPGDRPSGRGGCAPDEVLGLAASVESADGLDLRGVMTVADPGREPGEVFGELAEVAAALRLAHPRATVVSAGMSGDFQQAIAAGATHLRIGSAILGERV